MGRDDIADAIECFWNAAIGAANDRQDFTTISVIGAMAEGISAIATRMREQAKEERSSFLEVEPSNAERAEWPDQTRAYVESLEQAIKDETPDGFFKNAWLIIPGQNYLIWSEEHGAWWAPGRNGYTKSMRRAGWYSAEEARAIVKSANYGIAFNETLIAITEEMKAALALKQEGR